MTPLTEEKADSRSFTVVMADRAAVAGLLATVNAQRCSSNCAALEARRVTLTAKLDALDAEAGEIRRQQLAQDRTEERRDSLIADPVTARLAALLGTTATRVDLLSGLAFAAVLEGVACLLWTVTLRSRSPVPAVPAIVAAVTGNYPPVMASHAPEYKSHEVEVESCAPVGEPVTPLPEDKRPDPDVTQLALDVAAGRVRPTVAAIRRHLGCSQARAAALRRQLAVLDST